MSTKVKKNGAKRVKKSKKIGKSGTGKIHHRVVQLAVSVILFLVVFLGRSAHSASIGVLDDTIAADVDFRAVFQLFADALSEDAHVVDALKNLGVSLLGGNRENLPEAEETKKPAVNVIPLIETRHFGLDFAVDYGVLKGGPRVSDLLSRPEVSAAPEVETAPVVVTAMAQTHGADGKALPSNVSFQHYELGLGQTVIPVAGEITSGFGYRKNPITGKNEFHLALDVAAPAGSEIFAFADGVVRYIGESDEFGLYFMIDHANNVSTFYAHCSKLMVKKGEQVSCGQVVALVGKTGNATGAHLHLTIVKDGIRLDPAYYVEF